jgi:hypothetical protein
MDMAQVYDAGSDSLQAPIFAARRKQRLEFRGVSLAEEPSHILRKGRHLGRCMPPVTRKVEIGRETSVTW